MILNTTVCFSCSIFETFVQHVEISWKRESSKKCFSSRKCHTHTSPWNIKHNANDLMITSGAHAQLTWTKTNPQQSRCIKIERNEKRFLDWNWLTSLLKKKNAAQRTHWSEIVPKSFQMIFHSRRMLLRQE